MAVDNHGMPTETGPAGSIAFHIVFQHRGIALAESVDIDDGAEIIESVMARNVGRFPDRPFDGFSIPHQDVGSIACLVDAFGIQREADADREALAKGACRHVDE